MSRSSLSMTLQNLPGGYIFLLTPFLHISQPFLVPSPTPDLYEVTPCSTLLPISAFPHHWKSPESLRSIPCSLSLPTPFSHVYMSLVWTSVFQSSEFSPSFSVYRLASPNLIGFSWESVYIRVEPFNL